MGNDLRALKSMVSVMNHKALKSDIFKGVKLPSKKRVVTKKQEPRKRDENILQRRVMQDLSILNFHKRLVHYDRLNSGMAQRGSRWIRLCAEGTSDVFIMLPGRLILFIEFKSLIGMQNKAQKIFQEKVESAGHKYYIVDSWDKWVEVKGKHIVDFV